MFAYKKERDGYGKWMMGNLASGGVCDFLPSILLVAIADQYLGCWCHFPPLRLLSRLRPYPSRQRRQVRQEGW